MRLGGREVEYRFARRRRRTLGITVDAEGLRISAPLRAPWRDIEGFVREKERWILAKLDEWAQVPRPAVLHGAAGERLPLFGETVELRTSMGVPGVLKWLKATALEALRQWKFEPAVRGGQRVACGMRGSIRSQPN